MSTNFHLAPPSKTVDGLLAVPIDIQTIAAVFTFDGAAQTAVADATITYTVGPYAGNPIFDLRQDITQAWLDGVTFAVAKMAHHNFGGIPFTDLRVIESVQAAGSVHTLRVQYNLALPDSELGGSYPPALQWSAGPKLEFVFGLSDLYRARYAEAWLPANLVFDQYSIDLEIQIVNTMAAHSVITNGIATSPGLNHWQISFPVRFSAVSPMLEVRASDTVTEQTDTVSLPVSGKTVTIDAWKPTSSTVDLTTEINNVKTLLTDYENAYGAYLHEERFVVFFNGSGGMEYEGGTTTSTAALAHETFHSWFARGAKPASQADGWWDEGLAKFHDAGADDPVPFDFLTPPVLLCSRDPWQRHTPLNSYSDGSGFWKGMASLLGVSNLRALMADFYSSYKGKPVSTQMLEGFLLSRSGEPRVVDAFHRFVYGLADPSPAPDLWMKDDPAHAGSDQWEGPFWDSPDLWIRNADDDGTDHQSPEYGQDNWFYARVRNKAGAGAANHFAITFNSSDFAGTEFVYPGDFLPCTAAKVEFDLAAGGTRIVKARWPRSLVPPVGTHTCLLASVISRADCPIAGRHVWEHNSLAQKNLAVVDLLPDSFVIIPVVVANWLHGIDSSFNLEIWRPRTGLDMGVSLIHRSEAFFRSVKAEVKRFDPKLPKPRPTPRQILLDCGGRIPGSSGVDPRRILTSETPDLVLQRFPDSWEVKYAARPKTGLPVDIPPFSQVVVGLKVSASPRPKVRQPVKLHFVQRHRRTRRIVGGVAIQVRVKDKD